ncbi:hypothetical protein J3459_012518 [Metarhizium acridum]|nr:hypothetical protein J3459_012518 [Metarhizium acridum]
MGNKMKTMGIVKLTYCPVLVQQRSSNFFILLVVCSAVFTDIFLYGILLAIQLGLVYREPRRLL